MARIPLLLITLLCAEVSMAQDGGFDTNWSGGGRAHINGLSEYEANTHVGGLVLKSGQSWLPSLLSASMAVCGRIRCAAAKL